MLSNKNVDTGAV